MVGIPSLGKIGGGLLNAKNSLNGFSNFTKDMAKKSKETLGTFGNKIKENIKNRSNNNNNTRTIYLRNPNDKRRSAVSSVGKGVGLTISKTGSFISNIFRLKLIIILIKLALFLGLFFIIGSLLLPNTTLLPAHIVSNAITSFISFTTNFKYWIEDFNPTKAWNAFINKQMAIATGGYYEGQVDKQRQGSLKKPLGIEIKNFNAQKSYFTSGEEDVVLWGNIFIRMLSGKDDINKKNTQIESYCSIRLAKGDVKFTKSQHFTVSSYGEEHAECDFKKDLFVGKKGSYMVKLNVKFDFETLAYLRTYFMEESRLNLYRMQGKDPLSEYGIHDKYPVAVYTSGPVKLAIGTNDEFPLNVPENGEESTIFGITIENRNKGSGFIDEIKAMNLEVPKGLSLDKDSCDFNFELSGEEEDPYSHVKYKRYKVLLKDNKLTSDKIRFINDYLTLHCKLLVDNRDELLQNNAFAVQYLRADVKYRYILSKTKPIYLKTEDELKEENEKLR